MGRPRKIPIPDYVGFMNCNSLDSVSEERWAEVWDLRRKPKENEFRLYLRRKRGVYEPQILSRFGEARIATLIIPQGLNLIWFSAIYSDTAVKERKADPRQFIYLRNRREVRETGTDKLREYCAGEFTFQGAQTPSIQVIMQSREYPRPSDKRFLPD